MAVECQAVAVRGEYLEYILDQLEPVGSIFHRRMFGGVGLYCEDLIFGILDNDTLYLKVDDTTRKRYEKSGSEPFRPYGKDAHSVSYYRVPVAVLEDRETLAVWAREAVGASVRRSSAGPVKRRAKRR